MESTATGGPGRAPAGALRRKPAQGGEVCEGQDKKGLSHSGRPARTLPVLPFAARVLLESAGFPGRSDMPADALSTHVMLS